MMTLPDAVVILNREIERLAIERDYTSLEKLIFIKKQIIEHTCQKKRRVKWIPKSTLA